MADYPSTPSTTQNTASSLKRTYPPVKKKGKGREQRLALAGGK
jgi:hypothetical protein